MVRSFGVQLEDQVGPTTELGGVSVLFNALSILIDVAPLFVLMVTSDWKEAKKYFSVKGFALGAIMNLMLAMDVLFVREDKRPNDEHLDVLFSATVGMTLGTAYTFLLLGHRLVTNDGARKMLLVLLSFGIGCYAVFSGIFLKYKSGGDFLNVMLIAAVGILNVATLYPVLTCKPFPDQDTKTYTVVMCFINTIDSGFFVFYAASLGSDGILSVVSLLNTVCGLIQFIVLTAVVFVEALVRGGRDAGDCLRSCGDTCCGFFQVLAILFEVFGRHERAD